jgi:hypothetical protein
MDVMEFFEEVVLLSPSVGMESESISRRVKYKALLSL